MAKKKVKVNKTHFVVDEPVFRRKVHVFLNYSHAEFAKYVRKIGAVDYEDDPSWDKNFMAFSTDIDTEGQPREWVILLKRFNWSVDHQVSLIHEIVHTIVKIFDLNSIPFNMDTQEFLAHEIGNLYGRIASKILEKTKQ